MVDEPVALADHCCHVLHLGRREHPPHDRLGRRRRHARRLHPGVRRHAHVRQPNTAGPPGHVAETFRLQHAEGLVQPRSQSDVQLQELVQLISSYDVYLQLLFGDDSSRGTVVEQERNLTEDLAGPKSTSRNAFAGRRDPDGTGTDEVERPLRHRVLEGRDRILVDLDDRRLADLVEARQEPPVVAWHEPPPVARRVGEEAGPGHVESHVEYLDHTCLQAARARSGDPCALTGGDVGRPGERRLDQLQPGTAVDLGVADRAHERLRHLPMAHASLSRAYRVSCSASCAAARSAR